MHLQLQQEAEARITLMTMRSQKKLETQSPPAPFKPMHSQSHECRAHMSCIGMPHGLHHFVWLLPWHSPCLIFIF